MNTVLDNDIRAFKEQFSLKSSLAGTTVCVTGATGLLGSIAVKCLLGIGAKVVAVIRDEAKAERVLGSENDRLRYYLYDFSNADSREFMPPGTVDYVIHFASPTASKYFVDRPVETIDTIYQGTKAVLSYAMKQPLKSLVFASSLEIYGTITNDAVPITEEVQGYIDPMSVRSSYPMAKRLAETLCHSYTEEYHCPVKIARLAQVFGAGVAQNDTRVFAQFARCVIQNNDITLHTKGDLCRCYCYTLDAITGILYILLKGKDGEVYNVSNRETYISIRDMAEMVCREFGSSIHTEVKLQEGMGYSPTTKLLLSSAKLEALGWKPHYNLHEMYDRLIRSMREMA